MKNFLYLLLLLGLVSCSENGTVNNSIDKTAIDKSITPSSSEQIIESTDGIRVIIPGGALNTDLGIKLIKLANPPKLNDSQIILGTNIFQLSLNGDLNFNSTIQFRVKYDKSKIQSGFTPQTGVKGMMFTNNVWSVSEFEIDVTNEEIVFFVEPTGGKSFKDKEILLDNSEVTFGDGYTINDAGQGDELLSKMNFYTTSLAFQGIRDDDVLMDLVIQLDNLDSETATKVLWNSNKFTIEQNDSNQFGYSKFNASGEINKTNWTLMNYKFQYIVYDNYSSYSTHLEEYNVQFNDIKEINYFVEAPVRLTFSALKTGTVSQTSFKNAIKSITYKVTLYEFNATTSERSIKFEGYLKSINWDGLSGMFFNLYQVNK